MILPLNAEMLAHAYDYLSATPPFKRWNLPASDELRFGIIRSRKKCAHYFWDGRRHVIEFSSKNVGSHHMILSTMAHEMIHLHMELTGILKNENPHDAAFQKFADRICKVHLFDRLSF
jgi:hypothetical protein